jgi:hypothetical protein
MPQMAAESKKSTRVCVRIPQPVFERLSFVARNTDDPAVVNLSKGVCEAVLAWLPKQEQRLSDLGIIPKKAIR